MVHLVLQVYNVVDYHHFVKYYGSKKNKQANKEKNKNKRKTTTTKTDRSAARPKLNDIVFQNNNTIADVVLGFRQKHNAAILLSFSQL